MRGRVEGVAETSLAEVYTMGPMLLSCDICASTPHVGAERRQVEREGAMGVAWNSC